MNDEQPTAPAAKSRDVLKDLPAPEQAAGELLPSSPRPADAAIVPSPGRRPDPEPVPDHIVTIFGGGHMARETAVLAARCGFAVDVLDTREDYARPERFPHARRVVLCRNYEDVGEEYAVDARHYVLIATHSLETDMILLQRMLRTAARYIGIMATRRKKETLFEELRRQGVPNAELACLRCPVGLDIGAEGPMETAIAIAAELIAARAGCLPRPRR